MLEADKAICEHIEMKFIVATFSIVFLLAGYLLFVKVFDQAVISESPKGDKVVAMEKGWHHLLRQMLKPKKENFREKYSLIEYRDSLGVTKAQFVPRFAPHDAVNVAWTDKFVAISSSVVPECPDFRVLHRETGSVEDSQSEAVRAMPSQLLSDLDPCILGRQK